MMPGLVVLVALLMVAGLLGSVLPFVPGTPLILAGAVIYALGTDFEPVGPWELVILAALVVLAYTLEYVSGAVGAKKLGGSRWAAGGALIGALVGLFFGPMGIVLGPILGAILFELYHRREIRVGLRSGVGTAIGMLVGVVAKLTVAATMVGLFTFWAFRG